MSRLNSRSRQQVGFSLLELVVVVVLTSVLAVVAFAKVYTPGGLTLASQAAGAADLVRRAQALALTHGRQTRVSASTSAPSTTLLLELCTAPSTCTTQARFTTEQAVTISGLVSPIRFNSLGQPLTAAGTVSTADVGFNLVVTAQEPRVTQPGAGTVEAVGYTLRVNVSRLTGRVDAFRP